MSATLKPLELACANKVSYGDDATARMAGRKASRERGVELWLYRCPDCKSVHLTKQQNIPEQHVFAPFSALEDFIVVSSDETFWENLNKDKPKDRHARLQEVANKINDLKKVASNRHRETLDDLGRVVADELHLLRNTVEHKRWFDCVKQVYGEEGLTQFQVEMAKHLQRDDIQGKCEEQARYPDEFTCRKAGREKAVSVGKNLWVYPCSYCFGWHITEKERAEYWHVNTPKSEFDDYADLLEDKYFWNRLVDMPKSESEAILRRTLYKCMKSKNSSTGHTQVRYRHLCKRLKSELHVMYYLPHSGWPSKEIFITAFGEDSFESFKDLLNALK